MICVPSYMIYLVWQQEGTLREVIDLSRAPSFEPVELPEASGVGPLLSDSLTFFLFGSV